MLKVAILAANVLLLEGSPPPIILQYESEHHQLNTLEVRKGTMLGEKNLTLNLTLKRSLHQNQFIPSLCPE